MSEVNAKAPFNSPINVRLDDILNELQVLISERPNDEKRAIKFQYKPEGAVRDLSSVLGCLECESPSATQASYVASTDVVKTSKVNVLELLI